MSGITFAHLQSSIPTINIAHMLAPSAFLGCIIPSSNHVVNNVVSLGPMTSGLFLLSSNQASNPLTIIYSTYTCNYSSRDFFDTFS